MQNPGQVGRQGMEQDDNERDCPLDPSATGPGRSLYQLLVYTDFAASVYCALLTPC